MITVNVRGLEQFIKSMKGKMPIARVGVLGNSVRAPAPPKHPSVKEESKEPASLTNAEVGAFAEFGQGKMNRSFLRVPITDKLNSYMEKDGLFDEEALKHFIQLGTLTPYVRILGAVAEQIVSDAFASGGFGKWAPSDMKNKKVHQTLVETQQLRDSITSEVME